MHAFVTGAARVHDTADLSPDGDRIAFGRPQGGTTQIVVADLSGRGEQRLSSPGMNFAPVWHPDGKRLAFNSMRKGDFDTYVQGLDGATAEVIEAADFDEAPAAFLSDGKRLVSKEWRPDGTSAVVLLDLLNQARTVLVSGVFQKGDTRVSPDDRWLAVIADPSGAWHVHVRPLTGSSGFRQLTRNDVPQDGTLRWAPRGTGLFFVRGRELVFLSLEERGDTLVPLPEQVIATLPRNGSRVFGVSPDGARVLVGIRQDQPGPRGIRVIVKGLATLARQARD